MSYGLLASWFVPVLPLAAQAVVGTPLASGRAPVARVAYVSDETTNNVFELFSVPVDGSAAPLVLSAPMPAGGVVADLAQVSGGRVLYRAEQLTNGVIELFIVPDDGSAPPLRLSGPLAAGGNVNEFLVDQEQVLYQADATVDGRDELFCVPLDGSAPPLALTPGLDVLRMFDLGRDGMHAVFSTYPGAEERLYVVPTDASTPPLDLAGSGGSIAVAVTSFWKVELTGDGQRVVFQRAENDGSSISCDLWSARLDGTALVQLNPGPRFGSRDFQLAPDGSRVVYVDSGAIFPTYSELVSARVDGTSWRILTPGAGRPGPFRISDDSVFCVFAQSEAGFTSLRLDRLDASQPFELLAPATGTFNLLELVGGGTTLVFLRDGVLHSLASPGVAVPFSSADVYTGHTLGYPIVAFSGDNRHALYRSRDAVTGVEELHCAPLDGSQPPWRLNPPLSGERDVANFRLVPGGHVLYQADQAANDRSALFGVELDGSRPPVELNGALATDRDVISYGEPQRARRPLRAP